MSRFTDWTFRLRALFGRGSLESQVDQEFAFHVANGSGEAPARRMERRQPPTLRRAVALAARRVNVNALGMPGALAPAYDMTADVRHALRQMRRRPGYTTLAIATLGLGIGSTTALFAVVYGLLMRPLPFKADGLSVFWSEHNWRGSEYDHVREGSLAFEHIAAYSMLARTTAHRANGSSHNSCSTCRRRRISSMRSA